MDKGELSSDGVHGYRRIAVLGRGAFGTVYKAIDPNKSGCFVALKKIHIQTDEQGLPVNILREISHLRQLDRYDHPNIIRMLDVVVVPCMNHEVRLFLVFEYVSRDLSVFLAEYAARHSTLPPHMIQDLTHQLLSGVDFLHSNLITHRDIKPQNILITNEAQLKLGDFGLARIFQSRMPLTMVVVTLWYRAPEVLLRSEYGLPIDLWSCGCILAELVTCRPLLMGNSELEQLWKIFEIVGLPTLDEWPLDSTIPWQFFGGRGVGAASSGNRRRGSLLADLLPDLSLSALDLLQKLLRFTPQKRPNAQEALQHSYFGGFRSRYAAGAARAAGLAGTAGAALRSVGRAAPWAEARGGLQSELTDGRARGPSRPDSDEGLGSAGSSSASGDDSSFCPPSANDSLAPDPQDLAAPAPAPTLDAPRPLVVSNLTPPALSSPPRTSSPCLAAAASPPAASAARPHDDNAENLNSDGLPLKRVKLGH